MGLPVIGLIENMSGFTCPHCGTHIDLFKKGGGKTAAKEYQVPFLGAIPIDQAIVKQGDAGETIALTKSNTQIKKIFEKIVKNIQPQLTTTKK